MKTASEFQQALANFLDRSSVSSFEGHLMRVTHDDRDIFLGDCYFGSAEEFFQHLRNGLVALFSEMAIHKLRMTDDDLVYQFFGEIQRFDSELNIDIPSKLGRLVRKDSRYFNCLLEGILSEGSLARLSLIAPVIEFTPYDDLTATREIDLAEGIRNFFLPY